MLSCPLVVMYMQASTPDSLEQVVNRILSSRQITRQDQNCLLHLYNLTTQERALINRLFDRLRTGLIKVVD
ncbi:MAG: hypothetical protein NW224_07395 [Leptolyngbyaceae cyanobacterium bins.302]|nr:hypothetical protein [Leptolyngbyaceae cyanobacterium bins.302]